MKSIALLAVAAFASAPLAAQHDHPAPRAGRADSAAPRTMGGMQMESMGMHAAMPFAPAHLLERKGKLALTPQQTSRLEALRDAAKTAHDRAAAAARLAGDSLHTALAAAAPDTVLARRLFRAHHDAMGEAHWVMLRAASQAKAVLNDAQRGRVEGWADAMHEGHQMKAHSEHH